MTWASTLEVLPGLVGDIARWIDSTLVHSQPGISIPIALSFVAALKSKRVSPVLGVPVNLYTCSIAPSGTGKSQAQSALASLIKKCNLESLMMGKPASDSGLLRSLAESPRRLLVWDEFGIALSELAGSSNSYRALILATIMDLFSSAKSNYRGKEYSQQARVDIKEPYLSIFAASTPGRFFDSLSASFIEDGFLPRWLIFFSDVNDKEQGQRDINDIPSDIIQRILTIERAPNRTSGGNIERIIEKQTKVLKINHSELQTQKNILAASSKATNEKERVLWSRAYEQAIKISTILTDGDLVDWMELCSGFMMVIQIIEEQIKHCDSKLSESDNRYEKDRAQTRDKFLQLLQPGEKLSQSELCRKSFRFLSPSDRKGLINDLLESGIWEIFYENVGDSPRKTKLFRCAEKQ